MWSKVKPTMSLVFDSNTNFANCLSVLNQIREWGREEVDFTIDFRNLKHAKIELLTLIIAEIEDLRNDKKINMKIIPPDSSDVQRYISRVNFYRLLNVENEETFIRHDTTGSLIEIKEINPDNKDQISTEITHILNKVDGIEKDLKATLCYCLLEIIDNIDRHSKTECKGLIGAQVFTDEVVLTIMDKGIGIKEALSAKPNGEFRNISNKDALEICTNYGVSSTGGGKGLFFVKELIKTNKGLMHLCSETNVKIVMETEKVLTWPRWKGTYLYLRFKKNEPVDHIQVFKNNGYNNDIEETLDITLQNNEDELW